MTSTEIAIYNKKSGGAILFKCPNQEHVTHHKMAALNIFSREWACVGCGAHGVYESNQHPDQQVDKGGHLAIAHLWCDDALCGYCFGGLFACVYCGSAEGGTTSECPGERMTADQVDAVYEGKLDYRAGEWREEASRFSPVGFGRYLHELRTGHVWKQDKKGQPFSMEDLGMCPPGQFFFHAIPCTCGR